MPDELKIKCQGATSVSIHKLLDFQGDLKVLSDENYEKFKSELLELGFSEPISVWKDPKGKLYILNGHQRRKTILNMLEEGILVPDLPINLVEADDIKQAKKKVLALTSQFGELTQDGLLNFCEAADLNIDDILGEFNFPEVKTIGLDDIEDFSDKNGEIDIDGLDDECKIVLKFDADTFEAVNRLLNSINEDSGEAVLELLKAKFPDEL